MLKAYGFCNMHLYYNVAHRAFRTLIHSTGLFTSGLSKISTYLGEVFLQSAGLTNPKAIFYAF
jgi:hypothetical protein